MRSRPNTRTIPSVRVVLPEPLSPQTATINGFCIPVFCIPYRFVQSLRDSFAAIRTIAALGSLPGAFHRLRAVLSRREDAHFSRGLEVSRSIAEKSAFGYRQKRRSERAVSRFCTSRLRPPSTPYLQDLQTCSILKRIDRLSQLDRSHLGGLYRGKPTRSSVLA